MVFKIWKKNLNFIHIKVSKSFSFGVDYNQIDILWSFTQIYLFYKQIYLKKYNLLINILLYILDIKYLNVPLIILLMSIIYLFIFFIIIFDFVVIYIYIYFFINTIIFLISYFFWIFFISLSFNYIIFFIYIYLY